MMTEASDEIVQAYRFKEALARRLRVLGVPDRSTADFVQDAFLVMITQKNEGRLRFPEVGTDEWVRVIWSWLQSTAMRRYLGEYRLKRTKSEVPMDDTVRMNHARDGTVASSMWWHNPEEAVERLLGLSKIEEFLLSLPERDRLLVVGRMEGNGSFAQLAKNLGFPTAGAARQRFFWVKQRLESYCRRPRTQAPEPNPSCAGSHAAA